VVNFNMKLIPILADLSAKDLDLSIIQTVVLLITDGDKRLKTTGTLLLASRMCSLPTFWLLDQQPLARQGTGIKCNPYNNPLGIRPVTMKCLKDSNMQALLH
jgi:hypothetical protein